MGTVLESSANTSTKWSNLKTKGMGALIYFLNNTNEDIKYLESAGGTFIIF